MNKIQIASLCKFFDFVFVSQVTVHYDQKDGAVVPKRVHTIVISVQHDEGISLEEQQRVLKEKVLTLVDSDKHVQQIHS